MNTQIDSELDRIADKYEYMESGCQVWNWTNEWKAEIKKLIAKHQQTLLDEFEAIIGKDEHIQHFSFHGRSDIRDELRKEQREQLAKMREGVTKLRKGKA